MDEAVSAAVKTLRDEIRAKYPERAARAGKSAKSAIRLFCIECCGGDTGEARKCKVTDCFLWPHVKVWREQPPSEVGETSTDSPSPAVERRPPPPRAAKGKEKGPPLDRTPGALIGKMLHRVEADGRVLECAVTERGFEFGGEVYTSISAAAKAASGRVSENGWEYWR